jgi:hypothetical protein
MGHHISTRISEQIRHTKLENRHSAVAEHSAATKHIVNFDKTEVISNVHPDGTHIIREVIEITKHPHNFNHEDDYRLSKAWLHLFSPQATHPTTFIPKQ